MKNKRIFKTFSALCAALVLMASFSVTAFAQGTDQPPAEDTTNDSNVVVEETEDSPALTPEGNAALVDDFGGNKQLITVTTKAGNYFYILIDRANEDKETAVHFLNQVDEADLEALMEDGQTTEETPAVCNCTEKCAAGAVNTACPVCAVDMAGCTRPPSAGPRPTGWWASTPPGCFRCCTTEPSTLGGSCPRRWLSSSSGRLKSTPSSRCHSIPWRWTCPV